MQDPTVMSPGARNPVSHPPGQPSHGPRAARSAAADTPGPVYVYDTYMTPSELNDVQPSDQITFTWKGTGSSATVYTSKDTRSGDEMYGLFDGGTGNNNNDYSISDGGTLLTVKDDVSDGGYEVHLVGTSGVKCKINVKKRTEDDV